MELTMTEKRLIASLKTVHIPKDAILGIMLMMNTEERQQKLIDWLTTYESIGEIPHVTSDILMAACIICGTTEGIENEWEENVD